jgi:S1-C subfamily serine protease
VSVVLPNRKPVQTKPAVVEIVAMDEKGSPVKQGTGFFISSDGLVVTNFHVIQGAASFAALDSHGALFIFEKIVAQPTGVDLAVLKFRANDVSFLKLGRSIDKVEGEKVIVIGNPKGLEFTVSDGIISAFREGRSLIQITAPISHGSSGSPVMDESGQVIGVATLVSVEGQNLNFAIAVEQVSAVLSSQGIDLPKAEYPNKSQDGRTAEKSSSPARGVLMVTAKSTNVTFQENGGFLVFFGNGRSVAASIAKPESTEIGHAIRFKPGLTRSSMNGICLIR